MSHDPDALPLDVGTELRVFQQRIDDAGDLLRPPDPHAHTGDVVALSSWVRRRSDDIAMRGERHREISVVQGEPAGSV